MPIEFRRRRVQNRNNGGFKFRQLDLRRLPYDFVIYSVIFMPKDVPHSTETLPIQPSTQSLAIVAYTDRSFGYDLHLPFDCGLGF